MLVHVFDDTPHHYNPMQRFFTEQCQVNQPQMFWARKPQQANNKNAVASDLFFFYGSNDELIQRLSELPSGVRVVFHGLFELHIWRRLVLLPIVKQCSCIFWGAELYRHGKKNRSLKQRIAQVIHLTLIYRLKQVVALNPGDAQLVSKYLYRNDAQVLPYPLIGLSVPSTHVESNHNNKTLKVLIGNSAAASNEHCQVLENLAFLANEPVQIIVPLNYAGHADYIDHVIKVGRGIFGDKFIAITDMLDKTAYDELLASVDMTIFAHQRQQGLYVAYAMLLMGKPMFLCKSTSSFSNLNALGFTVYATEQLMDYSFDKLVALTQKTNDKNSALMEQHFTEAALAPKWSLFLNGLFSQ